MSRLLLLFLSILTATALCGCMTTRNGNTADNPFPENLAKRTIAILPVKSQSSITTDSHIPLKKALSKQLSAAVKSMSGNSVVTDTQDNLDKLNDVGKLDIYEKLITSYENTGAFDKKLVAPLCAALKADYLLLPKLKVEKLDYVMAKVFNSSLEIYLLNGKSSEPVWSGMGDFKRFGAYGLGGTETDEAANELVNLAFGQGR